MLGSLGPAELGIIALLALLLFGAGRIADIGKGLGQSIRNFKAAVKDEESQAKER
jgi:sec-independent protein translocase protein TatA